MVSKKNQPTWANEQWRATNLEGLTPKLCITLFNLVDLQGLVLIEIL
jgi:hypothetical protein